MIPFGDPHIKDPGPGSEETLGQAIHEALEEWEFHNGALVEDLHRDAVEAVPDVVFGERCQGCGDRGTYHGPGVCV